MTNPTAVADIDKFTPLEKALREQLAAYPSNHWYALVDSSQLPDLAKSLRWGALRKIKYFSLFDALETNEDQRAPGSDAAPYLLELGTAANQDAAIRDTVQEALETFAISWLVSPLNGDELARRLGSRTEAVLTENIQVFLRFYDNRILPNVLSVLTPEQAAIFTSAAQGWWYADRKGQLQSCPCQFRSEDAFIPPIKFSQQQENKLTELAYPDAVLSQLQQSQSDLIASMDRAQQHAFVSRQITKVKELKCDSMSAILNYCVLALVEGEDHVDSLSHQDKIAVITAAQTSFGETKT